MKEFKKTLSLSILLVSIFAFGQSAKSILDKTTAKMKSYNSMYITFDYTLSNSKEKINDKQSGFITMQGEKYNLVVNDFTQIFDGNKVYTISKEDQEVTISKGNNGDVLLTPTKILNSYKSGYKYTMGNKSGNTQYITLVPTKKQSIKKITIGVNASTKDLISVEEENTKGTKTKLMVKKMIPNYPVLPISFTFNKNSYKNYLITNIN